MKTNAEMILKSLDKYPEMEETAHYCGIPMTMDTLFCQGWLTGAKAAIDAILDDSGIGLMVYNAIQEQLRAEDIKEHLVSFYSYELCLKEEEVEKKLKTAAQDGTIDAITSDFLNHYNADIPEYDQIDTAIENYYADKEV